MKINYLLFGFSSILGYKRGAEGEKIIDKDQAKVVKYIYKQFLLGKTTSLIATELTKNKIVGLKGRTQ